MADDGRFLTEENGEIKEERAINVSTGAGDADKIPRTDAGGKLDITFMPNGIGDDSVSMTTFEDLNAGDWVNVFDDSGTVKLRKADATTVGKEVTGFVSASSTAPAVNTVFFEGVNASNAGLSLGVTYWLSTTAGGEVTTAPSSSGNIVQKVGKSLSLTEIAFEPSNPIEKV